MTFFGPVANAAQGGHSSPVFDLAVGFVVLILAWSVYFDPKRRKDANIWVLVGISAICAVFIIAGIATILHH